MPSPISLIDVATYYNGSPHQKEALKYLQQEIEDNDPSLLLEFAEIWRKPKDPEPQKPPASSAFKGRDTLAQVVANYYDSKKWRIKKPWSGYEVLIVGFEGATRQPDNSSKLMPNDDSPYKDEFNDCFGYFKVGLDNTISTWAIFDGTTEPGVYYTKNRLNPLGAARIVLDDLQKDIWQVGWHKGREEALVQTGNKVCVARDKNEDFMRTGDPVTCGFYGINMHSAKGAGKIGRWSAGCQVLQSGSELQKVIKLVKGGDLYKAQGRKARYDYVCLDGAHIASLCGW